MQLTSWFPARVPHEGSAGFSISTVTKREAPELKLGPKKSFTQSVWDSCRRLRTSAADILDVFDKLVASVPVSRIKISGVHVLGSSGLFIYLF